MRPTLSRRDRLALSDVSAVAHTLYVDVDFLAAAAAPQGVGQVRRDFCSRTMLFQNLE
jgi:hypothetical protein